VNGRVVNGRVVNGRVGYGTVVNDPGGYGPVVNGPAGGAVPMKPLIASLIITPIFDPDRVDRCRGTAAAAGNWSAPPPRGVGAPSRARSTS